MQRSRPNSFRVSAKLHLSPGDRIGHTRLQLSHIRTLLTYYVVLLGKTILGLVLGVDTSKPSLSGGFVTGAVCSAWIVPLIARLLSKVAPPH